MAQYLTGLEKPPQSQLTIHQELPLSSLPRLTQTINHEVPPDTTLHDKPRKTRPCRITAEKQLPRLGIPYGDVLWNYSKSFLGLVRYLGGCGYTYSLELHALRGYICHDIGIRQCPLTARLVLRLWCADVPLLKSGLVFLVTSG